ncbi:hypothetical protein [Sediminibacterium ginsengisoli]|uniref:Uncharacterized protein n=1 Tax=Sediminibacterium ginsengisoli TaxID=413434 RepID=A0A1T4QIK3_9BACT|nr:hypothetical protein [Sediminibacterium ginsengisoli]SKA03476.1 hypothetical protein SAMN04488132_108152 [Sediminibacterium ginsengisoli]
MKSFVLLIFLIPVLQTNAQFSRDSIYSNFVLYGNRLQFDSQLRNKDIDAVFSKKLDSTTEEQYREACQAVSQFLIRSLKVQQGFEVLFKQYNELEPATRRAFLEAVYAVYPTSYSDQVNQLLQRETIPKLYAMQSVYLNRAMAPHNLMLRDHLKTHFNRFDTLPVLLELDRYLAAHDQDIRNATPSLYDLFSYRKAQGIKTIYSFQRWDRDYPGLAVIQKADGSFERDAAGRLLVFRQLARSASDLPYFITDGSTPQGIFSIQGTAVSRNNLIGPTPNIQLVMPFETDSGYYHHPVDSTIDPLINYLSLLPASWRNYMPVTEAFYAGRIGRSEIIAHGTTIDPDYYKGMPFYPLTPTMGCLCAQESWNIFNGGILQSDQLNLVNAFLASPGDKGYLFVINLDNRKEAVSAEEIERIVGGM